MFSSEVENAEITIENHIDYAHFIEEHIVNVRNPSSLSERNNENEYRRLTTNEESHGQVDPDKYIAKE
jgi:hypothetical protein